MPNQITPIPTRSVGPIPIIFNHQNQTQNIEPISVPMATYETPLWPSTARGAKVARLSNGIKTTHIKQSMTRSILLYGPSSQILFQYQNRLKTKLLELKHCTEQTSQYAKLINYTDEIIGTNWFIRFEFTTGDAAGHNMATKAAEALQLFILKQFSDLKYGSISGNICTDKKVSAINSLLGRGHHVIAEIIISREICEKYLKTTPEKIIELNHHKNYLGSNLAGSLRSANAHFANMLLAIYLATGQDAANIIEASQGLTYCKLTDSKDLYFSVNLPNLIMGTVGNGKHHSNIMEYLKSMGCQNLDLKPGENSKRLAQITAAAVLCGELSLLAAQTNPGELVKSHMAIERRNQNKND